MKKLFTLIAICAFFAGCNTEDPISNPNESLTIDEAMLTVNLNGDENTVRLKFTTTVEWTASMDNATSNWITMSKLHGTAGEVNTSFVAKINNTKIERKGSITLKAGETTKVISITQAAQPVIEIKKITYEIDNAGGEIMVEVLSNADFSVTPSQKWVTMIDKTPSTATVYPPITMVRLRVEANSGTDRGASVKFAFQDIELSINIVQGYASTDFSADGATYTLQTATEGAGIDIILMGDAYTDRLIADGTYRKHMEKTMEAFFTAEPYKTFRNMFNIHVVNAVSKYGTYTAGAQTAFNCTIKDQVICNGEQQKCYTYAKKINGITGITLEKAVVIVLMNTPVYAGTCYLSAPAFDYASTYGNGTAIAFFPLGTNDTMFNQIIVHEAGGHGFPKLTDEYRYSGHVSDGILKQCAAAEGYGWYKNVSTTADKYAVKWANLLSDTRYANEGLGIIEGAMTFITGVYRPTQESIMSNNLGLFNAPSREAIYVRLHKLAYGSSWDYTPQKYEEFVAYDAINRVKTASAPRVTPTTPYMPLPTPVVSGF